MKEWSRVSSVLRVPDALCVFLHLLSSVLLAMGLAHR